MTTSTTATPSEVHTAADVAQRLQCASSFVPIDRNDLTNKTPISAGTCTIEGETVNLDVYSDAGALRSAKAMASTVGCVVARMHHVTDDGWLAGPNWVASTTDLTLAERLAPRDPAAKLQTIHC